MSRSPLESALAAFRSLCLRTRSINDSIIAVVTVPYTQENVLYHYLPLTGVLNYEILALAVINPKLVRNFNASLGIRWELLNVYLATSVLGISLHLYSRRMMGGQTLHTRAAYSLYFGGLFVLGSVLSWSLLARSVLPWNPLVRTVVAVTASSGMLHAGRSFLRAIDAKLH